jgi:factor associated with neutral sphingomyelinase activation
LVSDVKLPAWASSTEEFL